LQLGNHTTANAVMDVCQVVRSEIGNSYKMVVRERHRRDEILEEAYEVESQSSDEPTQLSGRCDADVIGLDEPTVISVSGTRA
jgi:hypothetical protein